MPFGYNFRAITFKKTTTIFTRHWKINKPFRKFALQVYKLSDVIYIILPIWSFFFFWKCFSFNTVSKPLETGSSVYE